MTTRSRAGGFTLLEIAVALAIVGIGMVACMQVFSGSLQLQGRASRQTRAVMRARTEMDKIVFDPPKKLETETTSPEGFRTHVLVRAASVPDEVPASPDDTEIEEDELPRYVQVDVEWEDGRGRKTYTLKTLAMRIDKEEIGKEENEE
jgi:prepilin-type N-terminal cleavage/methylation domain-containing protein